MIIRNPRIVFLALAVVLLVISVSVGSTFTGAGRNGQNVQGSDFPEVTMVFSSDNTDLEQLGRDGAEFYYTQFMDKNVPRYWHITKYEPLSCWVMAGNETENTLRPILRAVMRRRLNMAKLPQMSNSPSLCKLSAPRLPKLQIPGLTSMHTRWNIGKWSFTANIRCFTVLYSLSKADRPDLRGT